MEKTREYALNEALEMGYKAAGINSFNEMALRESLAQDIESFTCVDGCHECDFCKGLFQAVNVVRGNSLERIY
jgi:hypothetical protein